MYSALGLHAEPIYRLSIWKIQYRAYIRGYSMSLWGYTLSLWGVYCTSSQYMAAQIKLLNGYRAHGKCIDYDIFSAQALCCLGIKMPTDPSGKTVCSSAQMMSAVAHVSASAGVRHMLICVFATRRTSVHGCTRESGTPATFKC